MGNLRIAESQDNDQHSHMRVARTREIISAHQQQHSIDVLHLQQFFFSFLV